MSNENKTTVSMGLGCDKGNVFYRDGKILCGKPGCKCGGVPVLQLVLKLFNSGGLSLDDLVRANSPDGHALFEHVQLTRVVNVGAEPRPIKPTTRDFDVLRQQLEQNRRKTRGNYSFYYVGALLVWAPDRLEEFLQPSDWNKLVKEGDGYFWYQQQRLQTLRTVNPAVADEIMAKWLQGLWDNAEARMEEVRHGSYEGDYPGEGDYDRDPAKAKREEAKRLATERCSREEASGHQRAIRILGAAADLAEYDHERGLAFLTEEDYRRIDAAVLWNLKRVDVWNALFLVESLQALSLDRAKEHLLALWPRYKEWLERQRGVAHRCLERFISHDQGTNGWENMYFGELPRVHAILPQLVREVVQPRDWLLLTAELEIHRANRDATFQIGSVTQMLELQPFYEPFFP